MKKSFLLLLVLALVAACSSGSTTDTTAADTTSGTTDTIAADSTSPAPETTAPAETTTSETTSTSGGGQASDADAEFVRQSMAAAEQNPASRIEGVLAVEIEGEGTVEMPMSILTDPSTGDSAMTMDMQAMAAASGEEVPAELASLMGSMEVREIGDLVYIKFPFITAFLGAETEWVSMPAEDGDDFTGGMGSGAAPSDPGSFVESFSQVEGSVERIGSEDVRGISTTHFRLVVAEGWQSQLSEEELAELENQGPLPPDEFPMDIWISDDGLVHRMVMTIEGTEADDFVGMTMTFDFFDFGKPQAIEPPPADQVTSVDDLESAFGGVQP